MEFLAFRSKDGSARTMAPTCPISRGSSSTPQDAAIADGECARTRQKATGSVSSTARKRTRDLHLSREYLASAAHLARKHSFKPLKLAVERSSKRQVTRVTMLLLHCYGEKGAFLVVAGHQLCAV